MEHFQIFSYIISVCTYGIYSYFLQLDEYLSNVQSEVEQLVVHWKIMIIPLSFCIRGSPRFWETLLWGFPDWGFGITEPEITWFEIYLKITLMDSILNLYNRTVGKRRHEKVCNFWRYSLPFALKKSKSDYIKVLN